MSDDPHAESKRAIRKAAHDEYVENMREGRRFRVNVFKDRKKEKARRKARGRSWKGED